ncbi:MAG: thiamine phosphate synthase [Thermodesulfobacteriota bacterium]
MGNGAAIRGLYAIVDSSYIPPRDFAGAAGRIIEGGCGIIQVRAKGLPAGELVPFCLAVRRVTQGRGALLIVNDSVEAALAVGADGVHIGQEDGSVGEARAALGPGAIVGISTHSIDEALRAEAEGADYVSFGPIFPTRTKKDADAPKGLAALRGLSGAVSVPVVAIGGIDEKTAVEVLRAGASCAAMISEILLGPEITARVSSIVSSMAGEI